MPALECHIESIANNCPVEFEAMNSLLARCQRVQVQLADLLGNQFEFRMVSGQQGDFDELEGFEFNSERCGGFFHL
jgi:hypothetical protein